MDAAERRNARRVVIGEGFFGVGMGLVAPMTVLVLLLQSLGASKIELGLVGSLSWAGWVLLQPLGLFLFGRRRRTKRFLIPWSLSCSLPTYLAMTAVVYFLAPVRPRLCATLIIVIYGVRVLGAGIALPFWFDWQAMVFRREIRGRVIGGMAAASALGVSLAALAAGRAEVALPFPVNYSLLFIASVLFFIAALGFFAVVREPDSFSTPYHPLKTRDLFRRFARSLSEKNFRNYLVGRLLMTMGAGAAAFYAVHFRSPDGGGMAAGSVITLGMFLTLPQAASSYLLGRLGDRAGHKAGVVVGAVAQVAAILVAYLGRGGVACAACFVLVGIAWSAAWVSHQNMLFETCPHDSRVAHITLSNMVLGPVLGLVPVATGWMMEHVGVRSGIGLTLIPTLLGVVWLALVVREPRDIEVSRRKFSATEAG